MELIQNNIAYIADDSEKAAGFIKACSIDKDFVKIEDFPNPEVLLVIGGDGFMLHTIHKFMNSNIKFYGINTGNIGFLLNKASDENIIDRVNNAKATIIHPLQVDIINGDRKTSELAINEISIIRSTNQAAKIRIYVDDEVRMEELFSDGVIVSTPAGSSAYNLSLGGPTIPIGANILALTPISPFRPRRWGGALLPNQAVITIEILEKVKRPVLVCADFKDLGMGDFIKIFENRNINISLLFDPHHSLEERLIKEQFCN